MKEDTSEKHEFGLAGIVNWVGINVIPCLLLHLKCGLEQTDNTSRGRILERSEEKLSSFTFSPYL